MALLIGTVAFVWSMAIRGIVSKDANRTLGILLGIAGAALLAGHVATAQVPIRDAAAGAQLQTVTRILRPGSGQRMTTVSLACRQPSTRLLRQAMHFWLRPA